MPFALKRAAVIVPPFRDFYFTPHRFSGLGAAVVKLLLERAGLEVRLFNFPLMNSAGSPLPLPESLSHMRPLVIPGETGRLSFFSGLKRFGPAIDTCVSLVAGTRPDACFVSVFAFACADDALALAAALKEKMPLVPLVAGGGGTSVWPEYFLRHPCVDFVLTGEAEVSVSAFARQLSSCEALPKEVRPALLGNIRGDPGSAIADGIAGQTSPSILRKVFSSVPNLWWKENGMIRPPAVIRIAAPEEIEIPFVKSAETQRVVTYSTSLSRGCPRSCSFCSSAAGLGKPFRAPRPEALLNMVVPQSPDCDTADSRRIQEKGECRNTLSGAGESKKILINFEDDNLLADEAFMKSAVMTLGEKFPGAGFLAENGLDYSFLSPETTAWLAENGMRKFNLSLGTIDPDVCKGTGRFLALDRLDKTLEYLNGKGIPSITYFICGFAGDSRETAAGALAYVARRPTAAGLSLFYAVPGLPGFTDASIFSGKPSLLCLGSALYPWNQSLSPETMMTAFRLARYINLAAAPRKSGLESDLCSLVLEKKELFTAVRAGPQNTEIMSVPEQDRELVKLFFSKI